MTGCRYVEIGVTGTEDGGSRSIAIELDTIEKDHLQSQNCTGEVDDVEDYRAKYPEAPTRTTQMCDKIVDPLSDN